MSVLLVRKGTGIGTFKLHVKWNESVHLQIIDDDGAWEGTATKDMINFFCEQLELNYEGYIESAKQALSTTSEGYEYTIEDNNFIWKKVDYNTNIKVKMGYIELIAISREDALNVMLNMSLQKCAGLEERITLLQAENERLSTDRTSLLQKLKSNNEKKIKMEEELYKKFLLVLNAKKEKIVELENFHAKDQNLVLQSSATTKPNLSIKKRVKHTSSSEEEEEERGNSPINLESDSEISSSVSNHKVIAGRKSVDLCTSSKKEFIESSCSSNLGKSQTNTIIESKKLRTQENIDIPIRRRGRSEMKNEGNDKEINNSAMEVTQIPERITSSNSINKTQESLNIPVRETIGKRKTIFDIPSVMQMENKKVSNSAKEVTETPQRNDNTSDNVLELISKKECNTVRKGKVRNCNKLEIISPLDLLIEHRQKPNVALSESEKWSIYNAETLVDEPMKLDETSGSSKRIKSSYEVDFKSEIYDAETQVVDPEKLLGEM